MLVLSRKKNESIIIDGKIEVKIIESEDGRVRIGIDAPQNIEIHRKEIFDQIMEENKAASAANKAMPKIDMSNLQKAGTYNKNIKIKKK